MSDILSKLMVSMKDMMAKQDLMHAGLRKVEHANSEMQQTIVRMETRRFGKSPERQDKAETENSLEESLSPPVAKQEFEKQESTVTANNDFFEQKI